jgi:hypothetical protein
LPFKTDYLDEMGGDSAKMGEALNVPPIHLENGCGDHITFEATLILGRHPIKTTSPLVDRSCSACSVAIGTVDGIFNPSAERMKQSGDSTKLTPSRLGTSSILA